MYSVSTILTILVTLLRYRAEYWYKKDLIHLCKKNPLLSDLTSNKTTKLKQNKKTKNPLIHKTIQKKSPSSSASMFVNTNFTPFTEII